MRRPAVWRERPAGGLGWLGRVVLFGLLVTLSGCASLQGWFPGVSSFGSPPAGAAQLYVAAVVVDRPLEAGTVAAQLRTLLPFLLRERGWQSVASAEQAVGQLRLTARQYETYRDFNPVSLVQFELTIETADSAGPLFLARVWTSGQADLLDVALVQNLLQRLVATLPAGAAWSGGQ